MNEPENQTALNKKDRLLREKARPAADRPLSNSTWGTVAGSGFLALLIEIGLLIGFLPRLRQYGSDVLTFGSYCTIGVTTAVMLFGFLRSSARLQGKKFGVAFEFGGAAAICLAVVGIGINYEIKVRPSADFSVPIYFFVDGPVIAPILQNGKITLFLDEPKTTIIENGYSSPQRIPGRWNGVSVKFSVDLAGFTPDPAHSKLLLAPNEVQQIRLLPEPKRKPDLAVTSRYDIRTSDGLPYGWMYSPEYPDGIVAAPKDLAQMHSQLKLTATGKTDIVAGPLGSLPVASYLILLTNRASLPVNVTAAEVVVNSYKRSPKRTIWIWHRKGRLQPEVTEAELSSKSARLKIYPKVDEIAHLPEHDVVPLRLNLINVQEGIYKFHVEAKGESDGLRFTSEGKEECLACPVDKATTIDSLHILSNGPNAELQQALNGLTDVNFLAVTKEFIGKLPTDIEVRDFLLHKFNIKLSVDDEASEVLIKTISSSDAGLRYLLEEKGADWVLPKVRQLISQFPTSDTAKYLEIECLIELNDRDLAEERTRRLLEEDVTSHYGRLALFRLKGNSDELEAALRLCPDNQSLITKCINYWVVRKHGPIPLILARSFDRLAERTQRSIARSVTYDLLEPAFGLSAGGDCARRLSTFSHCFALVMGEMPEAQFWGLDKNNSKGSISKEFQDEVCGLLIDLGRFRLAATRAQEWSRNDLLEKSLWACYDFETLHRLYSSSDFVPNGADSYIFSCLTALDRKDFKLFDRLVDAKAKTYWNQTNFVHYHYNVIKGNFNAAKVQFGYYCIGFGERLSPMSNYQFGEVEEEALGNYNGIKWMLDASEKLSKAMKPYSAIPDFWHLCFAEKDHLLTEWYPSFATANRRLGRQGIWISLQMLGKLGLKGETLQLIRLPHEVCMVIDGKIRGASYRYEGLSLDMCKQIIVGGDIFFSRGVYGRKLAEKQVEASREYSQALYYYWNCGDADETLKYVDAAIKLDAEFYDALVLKMAALTIKNRRAETLEIGEKLDSLQLPRPKFGIL